MPRYALPADHARRNDGLYVAGAHSSSGFTLVELMVGLIISLIGTLAMMQAFASFEGTKRTTSSGNDAQQAGSYSMFEMERQIRTAGSAIIQGRSPTYNIWTCTLSAYNAGAAVVPLPAAVRVAPFDIVPAAVRAIPLLIYSGGVDAGGNTKPDVIAVISGNPAVRTFGAAIDAPTSTTQFSATDTSFGFYNNEYLIAGNGTGSCVIGKIGTAPTDPTVKVIPLVAASSPATGFMTPVEKYVFDLGSNPVMSLFGVGKVTNDPAAASNLIAFDMLQRTAQPVEMADGVVMLKALYGVDTNDDGIVDTFVAPTGATWGAAALNAGTAAASTSVGRIKSVRLAVVSRSQLAERATDYAGGTSLTLFADTASPYTIATGAQYRYRVYDTTVPLRNAGLRIVQ